MFRSGAGGKQAVWALKSQGHDGAVPWPRRGSCTGCSHNPNEGTKAWRKPLKTFKLEWSHCPVMSFWLCPKIYLLRVKDTDSQGIRLRLRSVMRYSKKSAGLSVAPMSSQGCPSTYLCFKQDSGFAKRILHPKPSHVDIFQRTTTRSADDAESFGTVAPYTCWYCTPCLFHEVSGLQSACSCMVARVQLCLGGTQRICFLSS